jgi:hypothetical protein
LKFDTSIANDLVAKLPSGKPIKARTAGSNSDQAVATEYLAYLQNRGVRLSERMMIGMALPPPEHKIVIDENAQEVVLTIAPSAN